MEGLASFTAGVVSADYQRTMPPAPPPESLMPIEEQLAPYAEEFGGFWIEERPFDVRYVDPPPRIAMDSGEPAGPVSRIWLRARGAIPPDPVVNSCVLTLQSALTPVETTLGPMRKSQYDISALLDHTVWFHRPADFSDWLIYEQTSPTGVAGRALATGAIYNRAAIWCARRPRRSTSHRPGKVSQYNNLQLVRGLRTKTAKGQLWLEQKATAGTSTRAWVPPPWVSPRVGQRRPTVRTR